MSPNITLHIDELVLHGFPPGDRSAIGEAVRQELTRLLAERGLPSGIAPGAQVPHLDGGTVRVARGAQPAAIGAQVARAVVGGMSR